MSERALPLSTLPLRPLTALALAGGLLLSTAVPAAADDEALPGEAPEQPDGLGSPDEFIVAPEGGDFILRYHGGDFIEKLGEGEREDEEDDVIILETDILFAAMEWEVPEGSGSRIAELTAVIPDGATVQVHGHTDSNPVPEEHDFDNQELSENRAEAVAEVLEEERPDLALEVEGFGDSQPAVEEDPEDPSTFAANRRVEIRYDS